MYGDTSSVVLQRFITTATAVSSNNSSTEFKGRQTFRAIGIDPGNIHLAYAYLNVQILSREETEAREVRPYHVDILATHIYNVTGNSSSFVQSSCPYSRKVKAINDEVLFSCLEDMLAFINSFGWIKTPEIRNRPIVGIEYQPPLAPIAQARVNAYIEGAVTTYFKCHSMPTYIVHPNQMRSFFRLPTGERYSRYDKKKASIDCVKNILLDQNESIPVIAQRLSDHEADAVLLGLYSVLNSPDVKRQLTFYS